MAEVVLTNNKPLVDADNNIEVKTDNTIEKQVANNAAADNIEAQADTDPLRVRPKDKSVPLEELDPVADDTEPENLDTQASVGTFFNMRSTTKLYPHQIAAVEWAAGKDGGILAADMGTGKTITSLAIMGSSANEGHGLIVMPLALISQWQSEITKHFIIEKDEIFIYHGSGRNKPAALAHLSKSKLVLTTYQTLRSEYTRVEDKFMALGDLIRSGVATEVIDAKRLALLAEIKKAAPIMVIEFGQIIVDEAHTIRNRSTGMFTALSQLRAKKRWCLTGTPGVNKRKDIISLAVFLGIDPYCRDSWWGSVDTEGFEQWRKLYLYIITKDTVLKLPPKTETLYRVKFGAEQKRHYNHVRAQDYPCLLTKILRLRQATVHNTPGNTPANAKFEAVLELLTEVKPEAKPETKTESGIGTLIFCSFKVALLELAKFLGNRGIEHYLFHGDMNQQQRAKALNQFNASQGSPVLLITIRCGGVGLNLVRASRVIILDPYWNLAMENQAIDRAHRIGQTRPVEVYRLIADTTIDEWVGQLQQTKQKDIAAFLEGNMKSPEEIQVGTTNGVSGASPDTPDRVTTDPIALGPDEREVGTKYF